MVTKENVESSIVYFGHLMEFFKGIDPRKRGEDEKLAIGAIGIALEIMEEYKQEHFEKWHIGDYIYYVSFENGHKDQACVYRYTITDISESGRVQIENEEIIWYDPSDPSERLFRTREEAQAYLDTLRREDETNDAGGAE